MCFKGEYYILPNNDNVVYKELTTMVAIFPDMKAVFSYLINAVSFGIFFALFRVFCLLRSINRSFKNKEGV
jgi:hypothetical protein